MNRARHATCAALAWLRQVDYAAIAERSVLALVLGIAALISYTHQREVWMISGAPWVDLGPLLLDGLFAAAWLRMRRRRQDGDPVGWLAWLALVLALAGTLAGNLAAPWFTGHRDPLDLVVAAVPAVACALVWELVTGHGRQRRPAITNPHANDDRPPVVLVKDETPALGGDEPTPEPTFEEVAEAVQVRALRLAPNLTPTPPRGIAVVAAVNEDEVAKAKRLLAAGTGRTVLMRELDLKDNQAKNLLKADDDDVPTLLARYRSANA